MPRIRTVAPERTALATFLGMEAELIEPGRVVFTFRLYATATAICLVA